MLVTITHLTGARRGARQEFADEIITIGRAANNRLCFGDGERRVSSHHAQITRHDDAFLIRDLGSTNGTMINGRRIIISELASDDLIEFGAGGPLVRFVVEMPLAESTNNHEPSPRQASPIVTEVVKSPVAGHKPNPKTQLVSLIRRA